MQLIKIQDENGKRTVNARELHEFLNSKQDFSTWIKSRIDKFGFVENEDFVKLHKKMELSKTGQKAIEYHLSMDMAKELSMVENNAKGREARQYFINIEKKVKQLALPTNTKEQALLLAHNLIEMQKTIDSQKPAVDFARQISATRDSIKVGDFAKILYSNNNLLIGQNRLFQWLYDNRFLQNSSTPFQRYLDQGIFEVTSGVIQNSTTGRIWKQVKITGKGIVYLTQKILESGVFAPGGNNVR